MRDREHLSPNFQDPIASGSDEKPVLQPKPEKPSYDPSVIPGGVIDVDAVQGTGQLPEQVFTGDFGFSSLGGNFPGPGILGLGGFLGPESKPWWKG